MGTATGVFLFGPEKSSQTGLVMRVLVKQSRDKN